MASVALLVAPIVMLVVLAAALPASARDLVEEGDFQLSLRSAFKSSLLLAFPPDDPILYPQRPAGAALLRLRFELGTHIGEHLTAAIAYEHRVRAMSSATIGTGLLRASLRLMELGG